MQKLRFVPDDGKLGAMGTTYMDFSTGFFHVDGDAPLTQEQVDSVWHHLPTTGASWVERENLFVQQFDGAKTFNLGPVERGVKGASDKVRFSGHSKRHHATKPPAQLQREIDETLAAQSGLSKHHRYLLSQRKPGGGLRAGYLTPSGWHGDPLAVEDPKLRLAALREQPAPRFPKEHHAMMKTSGWHIRQLPSGRRVVEKTRGAKTARIFQGEGYWTVTINRTPRGPFETTGEITRQSAKTLSAAKSLGTRLLR